MYNFALVETSASLPELSFHIEISIYDKVKNFPLIPLYIYIRKKFEDAFLLKRPIFIVNIEEFFPREYEDNEAAILEFNSWLTKKSVSVTAFSRDSGLANQLILKYFKKFPYNIKSQGIIPKEWIFSPLKGQEIISKKLEHLFRKLKESSRNDMLNIKGVLLYGQPGTGKTFIAYTFCKTFEIHFEILSIPEIIHAEIGSSERSIHAAFDRAIRLQPSVVFLDELEAAFKKSNRCEIGSVESRVSSQLILEFDRIGNNRILIFGITNLINLLDDRLFSTNRFELVIHVLPPDFNSRSQILSKLLPDVTYDEIQGIAKQMSGYTPSDIQNIIDVSRRIALKRELTGESPKSILRIIHENIGTTS
jgi:Cdc6-like AAA superfamily ATPase